MRLAGASVAPGIGESRALRRCVLGELGDERLDIERLETDASGDLLARRAGSLVEQRAQAVAGLSVAPPVLADLAPQVLAELRRADPRAQVVGGVEARIHIDDEVVFAVAQAGRGA